MYNIIHLSGSRFDSSGFSVHSLLISSFPFSNPNTVKKAWKVKKEEGKGKEKARKTKAVYCVYALKVGIRITLLFYGGLESGSRPFMSISKVSFQNVY